MTLPAAESAESLKILVAGLARPKEPFFDRPGQVAVTSAESRLVFVPFQTRGTEIRHPGLLPCIPKNLLEYGRNL